MANGHGGHAEHATPSHGKGKGGGFFEATGRALGEGIGHVSTEFAGVARGGVEGLLAPLFDDGAKSEGGSKHH